MKTIFIITFLCYLSTRYVSSEEIKADLKIRKLTAQILDSEEILEVVKVDYEIKLSVEGQQFNIIGLQPEDANKLNNINNVEDYFRNWYECPIDAATGEHLSVKFQVINNFEQEKITNYTLYFTDPMDIYFFWLPRMNNFLCDGSSDFINKFLYGLTDKELGKYFAHTMEPELKNNSYVVYLNNMIDLRQGEQLLANVFVDNSKNFTRVCFKGMTEIERNLYTFPEVSQNPTIKCNTEPLPFFECKSISRKQTNLYLEVADTTEECVEHDSEWECIKYESKRRIYVLYMFFRNLTDHNQFVKDLCRKKSIKFLE
jgi:hypothetical protein